MNACLICGTLESVKHKKSKGKKYIEMKFQMAEKTSTK